MTNENDFTCVLFADVLGFSALTLMQPSQAENTLMKFGEIFAKIEKKYDISIISPYNFSDSVVVGFKNLEDARAFSETLFFETFMENIPLRGTIGIGEFTHKPNQYNKFSFTIGSGLVLATMPEKLHIKGHTLLLLEKTKEIKNKIDERMHKLDVETIIYLEKTKEHMNLFSFRDKSGDIDEW